MLRINALLNLGVAAYVVLAWPEASIVLLPAIFMHGYLLGRTEQARRNRLWMQEQMERAMKQAEEQEWKEWD